MPLRVRLIALVGMVLLASLVCGSILVGWHAARSVQAELQTVRDVGVQTVHRLCRSRSSTSAVATMKAGCQSMVRSNWPAWRAAST